MKHLTTFITLIFVLSFTMSCNEDVKSTLRGTWSVDTIIYKHSDITTCLMHNMIIFRDQIEVPVPENKCSEFITEYSGKGEWDILAGNDEPLLLNIESKNQMFNGEHQILFKRDPSNKLLKMEIISPNLYVVCRKGSFSYDENEALINRLIMLSNKQN